MNVKTHLFIERKISTGQYENILIRLDMESEISSDNIRELDNKFSFFRDQFILKFQDTQNKIMEELKLEEKSAFISSSNIGISKNQKLTEMDLKEVFNDWW